MSHTTSIETSSPRSEPLSWPLVVLRRIGRRVSLARTRRRLRALDDRMLADIGLTRGDLRDAYSEPVWRDPTTILVNRAQERRVNRRRAGLSAKIFEAPSIVPTPKEHALCAPVGARYY